MLSERAQRIKPSPTIAVSTKAQELKAAGRPIINLGAGEPDFDTPQHIKDAAAKAIAEGQTKYTAVGGTPALKAAVAGKFARENSLQYAPDNIVVSTGAKQCIMNLMLAVLDADDEVVIPAPYWVSYPDMALLADARPVVVGDGFLLSPEALKKALTPKTKLVLFNSPSNPSGAMYSAERWRALGAVLEKHPQALIASDDIYEHIRYDGAPFANIVNACPQLAERTVVINGVSKAYAMTGWRIGYAACANAAIIKAMTKIQSQSTSNPCSVAQAAAAAALEAGADCVAPMLEAFSRRRALVYEGLNRVFGVSCEPIQGAFYAFANAQDAIAKLAKNGSIAQANDIALCEYLLEEAEVAAVPGSAFGCEGFFRISFATSDENLKTALTRIQKALA